MCAFSLGMQLNGRGVKVDAAVDLLLPPSRASGSGKRLANDRSNAQERATLDGMHQGVCLGRTFLWFLTKCSLANGVARRFAMHFTHRTTATLALQTDSAPGLASPTAHLSGDWPHRRHIGAGTVLRVAFLASFGALRL